MFRIGSLGAAGRACVLASQRWPMSPGEVSKQPLGSPLQGSAAMSSARLRRLADHTIRVRISRRHRCRETDAQGGLEA